MEGHESETLNGFDKQRRSGFKDVLSLLEQGAFGKEKPAEDAVLELSGKNIDADNAQNIHVAEGEIKTVNGERTFTLNKSRETICGEKLIRKGRRNILVSSDASKILAYYAMVSTGKEPTWD